VYPDESGAVIESLLLEAFPDCAVTRALVPDKADPIRAALAGASPLADFIITTGGTGIGPRDVTPEVTASFCEKELPGIAEALRAASLAETHTAMLSRAYAGIYGKTIIVNFPGSARACRLCAKILIPVMEHALAMVYDQDTHKGH
jgi:molybdenum cofactor synthesis domain-containing protein